MQQDNLKSFLLNSRKSFRNLFIYIERIKDTIRYIDSILVNHKYATGHTRFSNIAKDKAQARLDYWAWDWLPMYAYEFHFGVNKTSNISFSIILVSDTGFYDTEQNDKLNIDHFVEAEDSSSKIIFCIGNNKWFDFNDGQFKPILSSKTNEKKYISEDKSSYLYAFSYDLETFLTTDSIRHNLNDFITKCRLLGLETIDIK